MKISKNRLREIILEELKTSISQEELEDVLVGIQTIPRSSALTHPKGAQKITKAAFRDEASETAARYAIERIIKEKDLTPWDTVSRNQIMPYLHSIKRKYPKEYKEYHQGYMETLTSHHTDDEEETVPFGTKVSRLFRK